MRIIIGSDHGGFELKEILKPYIVELGYECIDYGTNSPDPVDYPDIALLVAYAVATQPDTVGVIIDGAGIGSAICANKLPGIRAAICNDLFSTRNSREHNDANILTMGGRVVGSGLAKEIVKLWLECKFHDRHKNRIDKIQRIEQRFMVSLYKG